MEKTPISINYDNQFDRSVFQFIAYLLQYPDKKWLQWKELVMEAQQFAGMLIYPALMKFLNELGDISLEDLMKKYVDTFDFNKNAALYLTYHLAGDNRERGILLLELKDFYRIMNNEELSDYLPVVLEFLAIAPIRVCSELFSKVKPAIEIIYEELKKTSNLYAHLIQSILIAGEMLESCD